MVIWVNIFSAKSLMAIAVGSNFSSLNCCVNLTRNKTRIAGYCASSTEYFDHSLKKIKTKNSNFFFQISVVFSAYCNKKILTKKRKLDTLKIIQIKISNQFLLQGQNYFFKFRRCPMYSADLN